MSDIDPEQHVTQWIEVFLAGGLSDSERADFNTHVDSCRFCAVQLNSAREADERFGKILAEQRPDSGFEDRVIGAFRKSGARRIANRFIARLAVAAAASIVLGGSGVVISQTVEKGGPAALFAVADRVKCASNLRQIGSAMMMYANYEKTVGQRQAISTSNRDDRASQTITGKDASSIARNHRGPGQNVLYGDGHVDWQTTPFAGSVSWRDNIYTAAAAANGKPGSTAEPTDLLDSIMLPSDSEANGTAEAKPKAHGKAVAAKAPDTDYFRTSAVQDTSAPDKPVSSTPAHAEGTAGSPAARGTVQPQPAARPPGAEQVGAAQNIAVRKIIRNGTMEFEVEHFDTALVQVIKIVGGEGGFVSTTDSDKLPNGHVRGTIVLRVPPEALDTLVLKLRGIGDLKTQKIGAEDITKKYTDLESGLRAARAMEERLLDIIKNGKGAVKDLLEAEKQLGTWREKIEQIEGEIRYYNNLVSLSTLSVSLVEKDIRTPAFATETEQITMALETPDVEAAYGKAKDAVAEAKGRIISSELKQYDAGQYGATLTAQLPPDAADAVIGRLKQSGGRVAHFERQRSQATSGGEPPTLEPLSVRRADVTLRLTMYNLANVAPRRTTSVTLAAANVEEACQKVLDQVSGAGGRVVSSAINHGTTVDQTSGAIQIQLAADKAEPALASFRGLGEVLHLETTENPDKENVTDVKRGISLTVLPLAGVPARQTVTLQLAATSVSDAFGEILNAARVNNCRVISSRLNEQDRQNITGTLMIDAARDAEAAVDASIRKTTGIVSRVIDRSQDIANTVDSKVMYSITLVSADRLPPRQVTTLAMEVRDVERAVDDLSAAAASAGGREIDKKTSQDEAGRSQATLVVEVPVEQATAIADELDRAGTRRSRQVIRNDDVPDGRLARARFEVTFANSAATLGGQESTWDAIRHGLAVSGTGLRWSLTMIVIGFCFVAPWGLVGWAMSRLLRRRAKRTVISS